MWVSKKRFADLEKRVTVLEETTNTTVFEDAPTDYYRTLAGSMPKFKRCTYSAGKMIDLILKKLNVRLQYVPEQPASPSRIELKSCRKKP